MFISALNERIEAYDPYGEQRLNGVKSVYILLILFAVNFAFTIPSPYFYFFFTPCFSMVAENAGQTIKEKYRNFIHCMILSTITIFSFSYFAVYWFLFVFVFFYSLFLYYVFVKKQFYMVPVIPISLAMGAYSLLYEDTNNNFYYIFNNSITLILATGIICGALLFFPLSYYYRLWLRALALLTQQIIDHAFVLLQHKKIIFDPVKGHTPRLFRYANMLPKRFSTYSVLKISCLLNELHLFICVPEHDELILDENRINLLITYLTQFKADILNENPCKLNNTTFSELDRLIKSWNYLLKKLET